MTKRLTSKKIDQFINMNFDVDPEQFEKNLVNFLSQFPQKKIADKPKRIKRGIGSY